MKGIRIAAYIAEIIVAGSTIVELVEKYSGRSKRKSAASNHIHTQGNQEAKRNICKSKEINLLAFSFIGFY